MTTTVAPFQDAAGWERALYAFLAEKERRSGSRRTVEGYSRMLQHFFSALGKPPDQVTSQGVFAWAYGKGLSGKEPSPATIGARLACLSSFYRFLIRMEIVTFNPCDQIERPKMSQSPPRGLSAEEIKRLLAVIPETPTGLRDRAIILTLTLTGRRRSEVIDLRAGDISQAGGLFYTYRGKGGKQSKRELPGAALEAIDNALAAFGKGLGNLAPDELAALEALFQCLRQWGSVEIVYHDGRAVVAHVKMNFKLSLPVEESPVLPPARPRNEAAAIMDRPRGRWRLAACRWCGGSQFWDEGRYVPGQPTGAGHASAVGDPSPQHPEPVVYIVDAEPPGSPLPLPRRAT